MLQILVWAVCVVIIGIGYLGVLLSRLLVQDEKKRKSAGFVFFIVMLLFAGFIFYLSLVQAEAIRAITQDILK